MRSRKEILNDIILVKGNLSALAEEIASYPWDSEESVVKLKGIDLVRICKKCLEGKMTTKELVEWANMIECREDIEFEHEIYQELIFEIANPEINGEITKDRLVDIIKEG